jgi:hypothetical protein
MARATMTAFALVVALQASLPAAQPAAVDVTGAYLCEGVNPDGTNYRGSVDITKVNDTYRVQWTMEEHSLTGIGILSNGVLAVSYFGGTPGVIVYRPTEGKLVGEWTVGTAEGAVYAETLTKVPARMKFLLDIPASQLRAA